MTYAEVLAALYARRRFGVRPGLALIEALLAALDHPERAFEVVHIAGTNGKGSTAAMTESLLRAGGRRTGLYTSPHLVRLTERVRVAGAEIGPEALAAAATRVLAVAPEEATFFELVTAAALLLLAEGGVEIAVLECGLGGRLDATNVCARPLATCITGIALDHTDVLGATLAAIAAEKAGILKRGAPLVLACDDDAARAVIEARAAALAAPVTLLGRELAPLDDAHAPALAGAHQRRNGALALALARLALAPASLDEATICAGLASARWPGRLERIGRVLLDAAHNADGARALVPALPPGATLLIGVVGDKDAGALVRALAPHVARVVATEPPSPRALPAAELAALLRAAGVTTQVEPDWRRALAGAGDGEVVVAGSIFLVGAVRQQLLGEVGDALVVQDPVGAAKPET